MSHLSPIYLGFNGPRFTQRGTQHNQYMHERLDRALVNGHWQKVWPSTTVIHGTVRGSDYCHLIVQSEPRIGIGKLPFHFKAFWAKEAGCKEVMEMSWDNRVKGKWDYR